MLRNERIKKLVKETLGCACPDGVFEYIDYQDNYQLIGNLFLKNKINIGHQLLIYTVEIDKIKGIIDKLLTLIRIGRSERDYGGFNRFRLVIITSNRDIIKQRTDKIFTTLNGVDEKVHLHVIPKIEYNL